MHNFNSTKNPGLALIPTRSWADRPDQHVFGLELSIAKDTSFQYNPPANKVFKWIHKNGAESLLFKALDKFAPLHPTISYHGCPSMWYSAPPSGSSNVVGIIIGKSNQGILRVIGTNFMTVPERSNDAPNPNLFQRFDSLKNGSINDFIQKEIALRMTSRDERLSETVEHNAKKYRTMPIYILVLDDLTALIAMDIAYVDGDYPSDMSVEFAGEII